jgi:hypothetical protein
LIFIIKKIAIEMLRPSELDITKISAKSSKEKEKEKKREKKVTIY